MDKANRAVGPVLGAALALESCQQFVSGQRNADQFGLSPNRREIAGRQIAQLIERGAVSTFMRPWAFLGVIAEKTPALFGLQIVELDLEREASQRRVIESLHQVGRANEQPVEALHLRQHLVDGGHFPGVLGRLAFGQEAVGFVEQQQRAVLLCLAEHLRDLLFGLADIRTQNVRRAPSVQRQPVGDNALTIYYKTSDGKLHERMLFRTDEAKLALAEAGRPWAFDAPGEEFKLAAEAYRINLAHLFDPMMAVHTSNVEPLPHQITAVYESMLPRQPLRYVLADDPGAGKTIMAGLLIRELLMRADAKRVLIVAPGSLVEQWQDEMFEKFGLSFSLFSREQVEQSRSGNPFDDIDLLVARVDQLSRNEDLQEKLRLSHWDLVVVDEAHKLSASYFGNKVNKTTGFDDSLQRAVKENCNVLRFKNAEFEEGE